MEEKHEENDRLIRQGELGVDLTWSSWYPLRKAEIITIVPEEYGIYKIRQVGGVSVPRLVGKSEIIYIGRSGISPTRTLRVRLMELLAGRHIASPRVKRLREELNLSLEYCFAVTQTPESAEKLILMLYEKEHYELPPLNHVGGL